MQGLFTKKIIDNQQFFVVLVLVFFSLLLGYERHYFSDFMARKFPADFP